MERIQYLPLPERALGAEKVDVPSPGAAPRVDVDSPAIEVMTDLRRVPAATIPPTSSLEHARETMIHRGVRFLLVCGRDARLAGVISATDLLGERPMQIAMHRHCKREELEVEDVMIPLHDVLAIQLADIRSAEVGHVITTLLRAGRQHALVIEHDAAGVGRAFHRYEMAAARAGQKRRFADPFDAAFHPPILLEKEVGNVLKPGANGSTCCNAAYFVSPR